LSTTVPGKTPGVERGVHSPISINDGMDQQVRRVPPTQTFTSETFRPEDAPAGGVAALRPDADDGPPSVAGPGAGGTGVARPHPAGELLVAIGQAISAGVPAPAEHDRTRGGAS
jgi:hypothetical protein